LLTLRTLLAPALASVFALAGCAGAATSGSSGSRLLPNALHQVSTSKYIQHIVIVFQENRSFDNFFATFPGANGATYGCMKPSGSGSMPPRQARRASGSQCPYGDTVVPLKEAGLDSNSLGHQHSSFKKECDAQGSTTCRMDGFPLVKMALRKGHPTKAGLYPYRYVNPKFIKPYWDIAKQYVLGDDMFTTQSSGSFSNHGALIAGGMPVDGDNVIDFPTPSNWGCDAHPGTVTSLITPEGVYRRDKGPFPCFTYPTIRDLLDAAGISWLYFTNTSGAHVWNSFESISAVRYGSEWNTNIIKPEAAIFQYIAYGQLPNVTWVIPDASQSDHPGNHSDKGPSWVANIVNAIGESPYWANTAVIVTWDDWGGQFDHVPPPQLDGQGLGMRVPLLIVSPYAREATPGQPGYISHTQYEFGSILKFMETNWGLGTLGTTDVRANNLTDSFDFTQPPRTFTPIQTKYSIEYFEHQKASGLPVDDE
jgi:phospholipase C